MLLFYSWQIHRKSKRLFFNSFRDLMKLSEMTEINVGDCVCCDCHGVTMRRRIADSRRRQKKRGRMAVIAAIGRAGARGGNRQRPETKKTMRSQASVFWNDGTNVKTSS